MTSAELKQWREDAGLSQGALAQALGLSQSQVSRYEDDPDSLPFGLMKKWLARLGVERGRVDVVARPLPSPVEAGDPYAEFHHQLMLLEDRCRTAEAELAGDSAAVLEGLPTVTAVQDFVTRHRKLPQVVIAGPSDAGKSRLLNSFLGVDLLPTRYQPTTRLITHVRHVSHRPDWLGEDKVVIVQAGVDPDQLTNETERAAKLRVRGDVELLQKYVYALGADADPEATDVIYVYADAPILRAAHLIDLPGDRGKVETAELDGRRALDVAKEADVVVYASPVTQFGQNGRDAEYLSEFIRALPAIEKDHPAFPSLGQLFIVATHAADHVSLEQLRNEILPGAREQLWKHMHQTSIATREQLVGRRVTREDFDARFFAFWAERAPLRDELHRALARCLQALAAVRLRDAADELDAAKTRAVQHVQAHLESLRKLAEDLEKARQEHEGFVTAEKLKQPLRRRRQRVVEQHFDKIARSALASLDAIWKERTTASAIEAVIREQYTGSNAKTQAKQYAAAYVLELVRTDVFREAFALAKNLSEDLAEFLAQYEVVPGEQEGLKLPIFDVPVDGRGRFLGGVGLGLAMAAGLPGGLVLIIGGLAWLLSGKSWQSRLASNIASGLQKSNIRQQITQELERFWKARGRAFTQQANEIERVIETQLEQRGQLIERARKDARAIDQQRDWLEELRAFFKHLPSLRATTKPGSELARMRPGTGEIAARA